MSVSISRLQEGVYQVGDKTLSLRINSDNDQILEVRVGSTWIKFNDHLNNMKHREEFQVKADLEDSKEEPGAGIGVAKKKKKKKKAKKTAELDLDMDEDDPT